ncbi:MAG: GAF domain-containing protein [Candidatus Roizmanbacteria bacterium]
MQSAPIPINELERIKSLKKLQILDTPPEERFDRITKLATKVFSVPISTLSLIDSNREWFKSVCGLSQTEGDRAISFCGHALLEEQMLIIPDAKKDPRFSDNPMVIGEPFIRFYAGVPVFSADGQRVGTFCIKGHEPREMTDDEKQTLKALAKWAELEVNSHNLSVALDQVKESIEEVETFFETSDDLMCIANTEGYFTRINPSFIQVLGYSSEILTKKPLVNFVHPDDVSATNEEIKKLATGIKTLNFVNRFRKVDGDYITLQWNVTPRGTTLYAIGRDVTMTKQKEDDLVNLNNAMNDRELKMVELKDRIKILESKIA